MLSQEPVVHSGFPGLSNLIFVAQPSSIQRAEHLSALVSSATLTGSFEESNATRKLAISLDLPLKEGKINPNKVGSDK